MYAIETSGLTKQFGKFTAVTDLNLKIKAGIIYGFLGPNGAGKTTTIKMLTQLIKPTEGEITFFGKSLNANSNSLIGYLPDVPEFYKYMTAVDYLKMCGKFYRIPKEELNIRIKDLLQLVELEDAKMKIGQYSRGMKQRLGLAQALIHQPKILILDEPTSALDPIGRKQFLDIIMKLKGDTTIVYSSHILSDVEKVCDEVLILNKGKVMVQDRIDDILKEGINYNFYVEFFEPINKLKDLGDIEISEKGEGFVLSHKDQTMLQKILLEYCLSKHLTIKKLHVIEPSLEDVFLEEVNK